MNLRTPPKLLRASKHDLLRYSSDSRAVQFPSANASARNAGPGIDTACAERLHAGSGRVVQCVFRNNTGPDPSAAI
eukprot:2020616-Rhodomonas_salina.2